MPPKRGLKRKTPSTSSGNDISDGDRLSAPDRAAWPGWVEMESEPAFFNVMLKEMGVHGIKVQEVYSLDDGMLAVLPQPVYALIFLFRYRELDQQQQQQEMEETICSKHVWFANQTPDFACATFALLNIVNNVPHLEMEEELLNFKAFTHDMDPLSRGDAVDSFDFVRKIHNSFARENDLLQADIYIKKKAAKLKKKQALAKARSTREAKKAAETRPVPELGAESAITTDTFERSSRRRKQKTTPTKLTSTVTPQTTTQKDVGDSGIHPFCPPESSKTAPNRSTSDNGSNDGSDGEFAASKTPANIELLTKPRRSNRVPQPRKRSLADVATDEDDDDDGFHFIAYMPIHGHVWKLDGLDRQPQDMGSYEELGGWMQIAQAALAGRMSQYEGAEIEFNLMAVVHDPLSTDRKALLENVKTIGAYDDKLDRLVEDWRSFEGAETNREVITNEALDLNITSADLEGIEIPTATLDTIDKNNDLIKLVDLRREAIIQQSGLRAAVRDALEASKTDEERARHRRHDYGTFLRSWMSALAEHEVLNDLISE